MSQKNICFLNNIKAKEEQTITKDIKTFTTTKAQICTNSHPTTNNTPDNIKKKMIDYTKKNLTTEKIASNMISDTIGYYE